MDRQNKEHLQRILSKELDAYFFDLDGTLIDSSKDIAIAANYALKKLGFEELSEEEVIKHVGYGGENLIKNILPVKNEKIIKQGVKLFRQFYFSNPVVYTKLYDDILDILLHLKNSNKKLAVITNKYFDISKQILEKLGIFDIFDVLIGGDSVKNKKPHPESIIKAKEILSVKNPVMIGDSETDINAGKKAGIKTILVEYGFGNLDIAKNAKPDFIVKTTKELKELCIEN
ncbi:MAG: HAD family hydrolase, partial [Aquificota bacterium]